MKVKREKLFLRNQTLEQNPSNQKKTDLYKRVRDHVKKTGFIVNPLLVVEDGDRYKVVYGNNRYLAGVEVGLKEFPIKILPDDEVETIRENYIDHKKVEGVDIDE